MKPLSIRLVVVISVVALAFGGLAAALAVRYGSAPLMVTPWISLLFVLIGVWLLIGGRAVRRLKAREETWVSPQGAARIAILARASAYVMAGSAGFLSGIALVSFTRMWAPAMAHTAYSGLAGTLTALFACVCAVLVERWCIDRNLDGDDEPGLGGTNRSAPRPQTH